MPAVISARHVLLAVVFASGMASLGIEFVASRLIAPYYGSSLFVWGALIGMVLIYLAIGYVVGGRLADRRPDANLLYKIVAVAALWSAFIPPLAYPVLHAAQRGLAQLNVGLVGGTLLAIVLLFAVPVTLLGCVSPFAIRLLIRDIDSGGATSGYVYALSTAGSIVGTFVPVFWLIPTFGTRVTLVIFAVVLLGLSLPNIRPRRFYVAAALVATVSLAILPSGIKPPAQGRLLFEVDSAYNYIQVVQVGPRVELLLNDGIGVQSIYSPTAALTGGPWDDFMLGPAVGRADGFVDPSRVAILGLAAGTAARELTAAFGPRLKIDGVEIDPAIVDAGKRFFHMNENNLSVHVADARYWLESDSRTYDLIVIDAYQQAYIPFHLTTREFFEAVRQHLAPGGSVVINTARAGADMSLVKAIASTVGSVFPSVFLVDAASFTNTLIMASPAHVPLAAARANLAGATDPLVREVAASALGDGDFRTSKYHAEPFTDDHAPVEQVIDEMLWRYVSST